jgi:hypothetical protein
MCSGFLPKKYDVIHYLSPGTDEMSVVHMRVKIMSSFLSKQARGLDE